MLENLNRINDAADSYRNAITVIEDVRSNLSLQESRSIFLDTKREVYDRLISLLIKLNKPDEAFICSEGARARAFYEMLAGRRINFGGSAQGDLIALEQDKRMEIQKLQRLLQGTREIIEPGTEDEVRRIVEIFPESRYAIGNESSETFVKEHAPSANILHFATHGIYNRQNPLYSHLLFPPSEHDDGRLNVYEVFEMNLDASLVTLSACETGLGDLSLGDEMTGLSRAFLYAGAGAVIVSMWPVADYPTALLMSHFYSHITELPLLEALTMAQREIIEEYPQPLYWAPFILVGNGNLMTY